MVRHNHPYRCLLQFVLLATTLCLSQIGFAADDVEQLPNTAEADRLTRLAQRKVGETASEPKADQAQPPLLDENQPLGRGSAGAGRSLRHRAKDPALSSPWLLRTVTALGAVIGLVLLLRLAYAKVTGRALATGHSQVVHVLARVAVAPRSHILIVRLGQRIIVVGESAAGLNALATIDEPDEVAGLLRTVAGDQPGSITRSFSQLLDRFNSQYPDSERADADRFAVSEHATGRARDEVSGLLSRLRSLAGRTGG